MESTGIDLSCKPSLSAERSGQLSTNELLQKVLESVSPIEDSVQNLHKQVDNIKETQCDMLTKMNMESKITTVDNKCDALECVVDNACESIASVSKNMGDKQLRKTIKIVNFPESKEENCESVVKDILINKMNLDIDTESAFRIGKFGYKGKPRHIVFKVLKVADKHKIFQKKTPSFKG